MDPPENEIRKDGEGNGSSSEEIPPIKRIDEQEFGGRGKKFLSVAEIERTQEEFPRGGGVAQNSRPSPAVVSAMVAAGTASARGREVSPREGG